MTPETAGKAGEIEETPQGSFQERLPSHSAELGHQGAEIPSSFQLRLWEFKVPALRTAHLAPRLCPLHRSSGFESRAGAFV